MVTSYPAQKKELDKTPQIKVKFTPFLRGGWG
jgi:hypothetical protein